VSRWRCDAISTSNENGGNLVAPKRTYTIVGVDPGTTTAFAVLDLKGQILRTGSSRSWGFSELVGLLIESGHPLIIATDKNPAPGTVERIKRAFNAILYTPSSSLSVEQKQRDTKLLDCSNEHERDALAAAIDAARSVRNKLESVEKRAPSDVELEELQMLVLRGHTVDSAINLLKKPLAFTENQVQHHTSASERDQLGPDILYLKAIIKRQDEQIIRLSSYMVDLKESLQIGQKNVQKLQNKIKSIQSQDARNAKMDKEVALRQKEIDRLSAELLRSKNVNEGLQKRMRKLKQIGLTERNKAVKAVKIVKSFNREAIQAADDQIGLSNGIVLFEDASGGGIAAAELLVRKRARAVIVNSEMSLVARKALFDANIPIFSMRELTLDRSGNLVTIDKNALELMIEKGRAEIASAKQQEQLHRLESLIETYKHERVLGTQKKETRSNH
jgi:predicted RNase H-like nuclease (RuvC/YqgF family)